jgi:hypothetical protein
MKSEKNTERQVSGGLGMTSLNERILSDATEVGWDILNRFNRDQQVQMQKAGVNSKKTHAMLD